MAGLPRLGRIVGWKKDSVKPASNRRFMSYLPLLELRLKVNGS